MVNTGNFSNTAIDLRSNNLTSFSSDVFQSLLESMIDHDGYVNINESEQAYIGSIYILSCISSLIKCSKLKDYFHFHLNQRADPIKYDCDLKWLIVDSQHLLDKVDGRIANGTSFGTLYADLQDLCGDKTPPPSTTSTSPRTVTSSVLLFIYKKTF